MLCEDDNAHNGYRERKLMTSVGETTMRIPKLRIGTYFPEDMVSRYSRTDHAVAAAVSEMHVCGVSTGKVAKVAAKLGVERMSASQVSRICATLDTEVAELQQRCFPDTGFSYLWLDATYLKCRDGGHVESMAIVAIACVGDGYRRFVGFDCVDTEFYGSWKAFLTDLRSRGIEDVRCVTSDAHAGLKRAIEEVFSGAA